MSVSNYGEDTAVFVTILGLTPISARIRWSNFAWQRPRIPFHDYAVWRLVVLAQEIARMSPGVSGYVDVLTRVRAELRDRYRVWLAEPR